MSPGLAVAGLLAATWLHLGFQATVTAVVYPALARVGREDWPAAHARHSAAIAPVVGLVYGALVLWSVLALARAPGAAVVVAVAGGAAAVLTTATLAAPMHGRLATPEPAQVARLLAVDRVRLLAALVAAVAASVAAWGLF